MRSPSPHRTALLLPLLLSLALAALAALAAAQEPNAARIRPGVLGLELSEHATSSLGVDLPALEAALCGPAPRTGAEVGERGNSAEDCHLVVGGPGGQNRDIGIVFDAIQLLPGNEVLSASVSSTVNELSFEGREELTTSCGRWLFDVTLDRSVRQPISILHLHQASPAGRVGFVAGTLYAAALIRFVRVDTGARRTVPIELELDAAGRWSVLDSLATPAGESNLSLFVDDASSGFVARPGCTQDAHPCGQVCLEATPERLLDLNGG